MRTRISQFTILISLGALALVSSSFAYAQTTQTVDELQKKISANTDKLQKLVQEIPVIEKKLNNLGTQKNTLNTSIKTLDLTRKKLETDIKITQTKVDTTDLKIRQLGSEISYKENEIGARIAALKEAILVIYEGDEQSLPEVALSNDSFSGLWNDLDMLEQFSERVSENVALIKLLKEDLEEKNRQKRGEKGRLLGLKTDLSDQKKVTENTKKQKTNLLALTNNQESKYQKDLREKKALKAALEKELSDYESTIKFLLDRASFPPRGTKVLSPPLDNIRITQYFGNTSFAKSGAYNGKGHNGADFGASVGAPVKSMLSGTIIGTGDTDLTCSGASYGRWVLIRHNNGLSSLYAHLSIIRASEGQVVKTGDVIGLSGGFPGAIGAGYSTGPHLHVSVYASAGVKVDRLPSKTCGGRTFTLPLAALNAYLDPVDYM